MAGSRRSNIKNEYNTQYFMSEIIAWLVTREGVIERTLLFPNLVCFCRESRVEKLQFQVTVATYSTVCFKRLKHTDCFP